jgi:hypothetical protein
MNNYKWALDEVLFFFGSVPHLLVPDNTEVTFSLAHVLSKIEEYGVAGHHKSYEDSKSELGTSTLEFGVKDERIDYRIEIYSYPRSPMLWGFTTPKKFITTLRLGRNYSGLDMELLNLSVSHDEWNNPEDFAQLSHLYNKIKYNGE